MRNFVQVGDSVRELECWAVGLCDIVSLVDADRCGGVADSDTDGLVVADRVGLNRLPLCDSDSVLLLLGVSDIELETLRVASLVMDVVLVHSELIVPNVLVQDSVMVWARVNDSETDLVPASRERETDRVWMELSLRVLLTIRVSDAEDVRVGPDLLLEAVSSFDGVLLFVELIVGVGPLSVREGDKTFVNVAVSVLDSDRDLE